MASDSPYALIAAALAAIPVLAGTEHTGFDFTVYTGDLVSHDPDNQLSRYDVSSWGCENGSVCSPYALYRAETISRIRRYANTVISTF